MAKHLYTLDNDHLDAKGRYYRRGEKIELDENDSAVKLCLPLGQKIEDLEGETIVDEKPVKSPASKKSKKPTLSGYMD